MGRFERAAAAVAVSVLIGAAAEGADLVVLESTAPAYSAGQTMDAASAIRLTAGEVLVVVMEDGRLLRVDGPHDGPAAGTPAEENNVRKALEQLVSDNRPRVGGVGAVRGDESDDEAADSRPEPWLIHSERNGDQCALRGKPVVLWREQSADAGAAQITDAATNASTELRWQAAAARAAWPADFPPLDERVYLVRFGSARSVAIRVNFLEAGVAANELAAAAWLAAKGCTAQARLVLR
jgi:hypothetical protein